MEGFPVRRRPEDLMRSLREFAEQQAETVQEAQREQFATLTLNTAVELTSAALQQVNAAGSADDQAAALRDAMRVLFPEAVALVSAARQGFMREGSGRIRRAGLAAGCGAGFSRASRSPSRISESPRLRRARCVRGGRGASVPPKLLEVLERDQRAGVVVEHRPPLDGKNLDFERKR